MLLKMKNKLTLKRRTYSKSAASKTKRRGDLEFVAHVKMMALKKLSRTVFYAYENQRSYCQTLFP